MVANDTGGAVTQVFAAGHPERLHTLTLTNCEAHDNVPPKALLPAVWLARMGLHARLAPRLMAPGNPRTRKRVFGRTYQDISQPARGHRARLAGSADRHPGGGPPVPAPAGLAARP